MVVHVQCVDMRGLRAASSLCKQTQVQTYVARYPNTIMVHVAGGQGMEPELTDRLAKTILSSLDDTYCAIRRHISRIVLAEQTMSLCRSADNINIFIRFHIDHLFPMCSYTSVITSLV